MGTTHKMFSGVFLIFYSISNCLFHLSFNYKYLSWNSFYHRSLSSRKHLELGLCLFPSCLRSLQVEKSILCSSWNYLWKLCKFSFKFQFPINYLISSHFNLIAWELVPASFSLSFSRRLSTVDRSPAFVMMDMNIAILLLLFARFKFFIFSGRKMICAYDSFELHRAWKCFCPPIVIEKQLNSPQLKPCLCETFIAPAGDFWEKIFAEWINIYLSPFAKPFSADAVPPSARSRCFFLMWKQIFNQEFFICGPLLSFVFPPFLLSFFFCTNNNNKIKCKVLLQWEKVFSTIYSLPRQLGIQISRQRWCEKLIFLVVFSLQLRVAKFIDREVLFVAQRLLFVSKKILNW